jgi:hypothetical protein
VINIASGVIDYPAIVRWIIEKTTKT